jgi:hypothetical protein
MATKALFANEVERIVFKSSSLINSTTMAKMVLKGFQVTLVTNITKDGHRPGLTIMKLTQ